MVQPPRVEGFNDRSELTGRGPLALRVFPPMGDHALLTPPGENRPHLACLLLPSQHHPAQVPVPVTVTGGGQRGHRTGEPGGNFPSREQCTGVQSDPPGASAVCLLLPRGSEPSSPVGLGMKQEGSHLQMPQGMESPQWSLVLGPAQVLESLPEGDSVTSSCRTWSYKQRRSPPSPSPVPTFELSF